MDLVPLLIWLIIVGLICAVVWWAVEQLPLPAPFPLVIKVVLILIILVVLLQKLLPLAGMKL